MICERCQNGHILWSHSGGYSYYHNAHRWTLCTILFENSVGRFSARAREFTLKNTFLHFFYTFLHPRPPKKTAHSATLPQEKCNKINNLHAIGTKWLECTIYFQGHKEKHLYNLFQGLHEKKCLYIKKCTAANLLWWRVRLGSAGREVKYFYLNTCTSEQNSILFKSW